MIRVPVAAQGCPIAMAPPQTFVRDRSKASSRSHARNCGANASFTWCKIELKWRALFFKQPVYKQPVLRPLKNVATFEAQKSPVA